MKQKVGAATKRNGRRWEQCSGLTSGAVKFEMLTRYSSRPAGYGAGRWI